MKWYERSEVVSYIIDCYAGIEEHKKRQFIWEQSNGDVVIGNTRAFTDHLAEKFNLPLTSTSWSSVHAALREMGEVLTEYSPRTKKLGTRFHNSEPEVRVLKPASSRR